MKDNSNQQLIVRWMDGEEMTTEELEVLDELDKTAPEDILDPTEFSLIRKQLKETFAVESEIPNGDLFSTLLEKRILREDEERKKSDLLEKKIVNLSEEKENISKELGKFPWLPFVMSTAACLTFGLLLGKSFLGSTTYKQNVVGNQKRVPLMPVVYPVDESLSIDYVKEKQCNVIVIEGLEAIPDDFDLFKFSNKIKAIKVQPKNVHQTN